MSAQEREEGISAMKKLRDKIQEIQTIKEGEYIGQ